MSGGVHEGESTSDYLTSITQALKETRFGLINVFQEHKYPAQGVNDFQS